MEEDGQDGLIKSIFLSEFHATTGSIIGCQYPENSVSKELFKSVSVYLIPKSQLYKKIITIRVSGLKITGYPNEIRNPKYVRNAFIFNLCFVCDAQSHTVQYEPVVKKLSEYFENLELENGFLSNEQGKQQLPNILKQILTELNNNGICTVKVTLHDYTNHERRMSCRIDTRKQSEYEFRRSQGGLPERRYSLTSDKKKEGTNMQKVCSKYSYDSRESLTISSQELKKEPGDGIPYVCILNLKKVASRRSDPIQVQDHNVPILFAAKTAPFHYQWDLTTQQIISYIDGLSHVAKIAAEADVDINLVKACVQNLIYYKVVKLIPIFQYSNVYTVLPGIHKLYTSKVVQDECLKTIVKISTRSLPSFAIVFKLYTSFTYGVSVRDLCSRFNLQTQNIDERKVIQFGLLQGFIRRIHQYPVYLATPDEKHISSSIGPFYRLCNGLHSIDEICCKFSLTYQEVSDRLDSNYNITIISK